MFRMVCPLMRQSYTLDVSEIQAALLRDVKYGFHISNDFIQVILLILCTLSHN